MQYGLSSKETPASGIRRISAELIEHIDGLLSMDQPLDDSDIHELRKTIKKLRALLVLLADGLSRKRLRSTRKPLRQLAGQLEGARDSAVLLESLAHIRAHFSDLLDESATASVQEILETRYRRHMEKQVEGIDIEAARCDLRQVREEVGKLKCRKMTPGRLRKHIIRTAREGARSLDTLGADPSTANSHRLRKDVKALWYQLRLFKKIGPKTLPSLLDALDRLGETLGLDHDMAMLQETIEELPGIDTHPARKELLTSLIESRRIDLLGQSIRLADRIYATDLKKLAKQLLPATP